MGQPWEEVSDVRRLEDLSSFYYGGFWFWILIILLSIATLALLYCFVWEPFQKLVVKMYRICCVRTPVPDPTPTPTPKGPKPFQHWYMNGVLELDQHDMEMMAPDGWDGRGHVPPPPGPHDVGYVRKPKKKKRVTDPTDPIS